MPNTLLIALSRTASFTKSRPCAISLFLPVFSFSSDTREVSETSTKYSSQNIPLNKLWQKNKLTNNQTHALEKRVEQHREMESWIREGLN